MMRIVVDFNGITKSVITVANITATGLSNDKPNLYNIFIDGIDQHLFVEHMREDGYEELCRKVFAKIFESKLLSITNFTRKTIQGKCSP